MAERPSTPPCKKSPSCAKATASMSRGALLATTGSRKPLQGSAAAPFASPDVPNLQSRPVSSGPSSAVAPSIAEETAASSAARLRGCPFRG
eukprot:scaffold1307_cov200-Pinguiococcus_pyrenoidosus.AAC.54